MQPAASASSLSIAQPEPASAGPPPWSWPARLTFRFVFAWLVLFIEPWPFPMIPGLHWISWPLDKLLDKPVAWATKAASLLVHYHGPLDAPQNGSGDRMVDWITYLACVLLALLIAIVWSAIDRRPRRHDRLYAFLRLYVRYYLAFTMLGYGFDKVFLGQMPPPSPAKLEVPLGDSSPMGLLWAFMGASPAYERFAGLAEVLSGVLLLSRRTALLGALASAGVLVNVVMLNFCYDVPVKAYSSLLLIMALFLCAYDAPRFVRALLGRAAPGAPPLYRPASRHARLALVATEAVAVLALLIIQARTSYKMSREQTEARESQPMDGRWAVDKQVVDGHELPPLLTEPERWRLVSLVRFQQHLVLVGRRVDDTVVRWPAIVDDVKHVASFAPVDGSPARKLTYTLNGDRLRFASDDGRQLIEMHKLPARQYLLMTRGFHLVNEVPFAR